MSETKDAISMVDVLSARVRIKDQANVTPLQPTSNLSATCNCNLFFKVEPLQRCKCFKFRGAYNKVKTIPKGSTVLCVSDGNHSQGVSLACKLTGCRPIVYMPLNAIETKVEFTKHYGGEIVQVGKNFEECFAAARQVLSEHPDWVFVHPYDDPMVIAGNGTIACEIIEQLPEVDTVVVPIGGGGLISGIAYAAKHIKPGIRIIGVNSNSCPSTYKNYYLSRGKKDVVKTLVKDNISPLADGINIKTPSEQNLAMINKYVDDVVLVNEDEIAEAVALLSERGKIVSEGSGAAPFAAVLKKKFEIREGENVACVISGGNIPLRMLSRCIDRALFLRGDRISISVVVPYGTQYLSKLMTLLVSHHAEVVSCQNGNQLDTAANREQYHLIIDVNSHDDIDRIRKDVEANGWDIEVMGTGTIGE